MPANTRHEVDDTTVVAEAQDGKDEAVGDKKEADAEAAGAAELRSLLNLNETSIKEMTQSNMLCQGSLKLTTAWHLLGGDPDALQQ